MRSRLLNGWAMGMALFAMASPASAQPAPLEADLILRDAAVYTPSGWAQAVAIKRGVIIAVATILRLTRMVSRTFCGGEPCGAEAKLIKAGTRQSANDGRRHFPVPRQSSSQPQHLDAKGVYVNALNGRMASRVAELAR